MMQTDASHRDRVRAGTRPVSLVVICLVVALGLASCTSSERPSRDQWRGSWEGVQEVVPPADGLSRPPDHEVCSDVLGELRERGSGLTPAPDDIIDEAAQAWLSHAESLFFECFQDGDPEERIEEGYATMERLASEVEAVLDSAEQ